MKRNEPWVLLFWLVLVRSATADGALEINQLCVATGCFDGDAPGFPVTISQSGSYRMTSNLSVPLGANGILLLPGSDDVSLDLGGHSLTGPTQCTGDLPTCNPISIGEGINAVDGGRVSIFNGSVTGFPENGITATNLWLRDVRISNNGEQGVRVFGDGVMESALVLDNGAAGARTNTSFVIRNSAFGNNGSSGVVTGICGGNTFRSNGDTGMIPEEFCSSSNGSNYCNGISC